MDVVVVSPGFVVDVVVVVVSPGFVVDVVVTSSMMITPSSNVTLAVTSLPFVSLTN